MGEGTIYRARCFVCTLACFLGHSLPPPAWQRLLIKQQKQFFLFQLSLKTQKARERVNTKDVLTKEFFPLQLEKLSNVVSRRNLFVSLLGKSAQTPHPVTSKAWVSQACLGCCMGCENLIEPTTAAGQVLPSYVMHTGHKGKPLDTPRS